MLDIDYVGRRSTRILLDPERGHGTHTGTVYAVCG
jgi:hypothetical protein